MYEVRTDTLPGELRMKLRGDWKDLAEAAIRAGCVLTQTGSNHIKWQTPQGRAVFSAGTPSDWRAIRNTRAKLRREGVDV